jgi:hypothetical protein
MTEAFYCIFIASSHDEMQNYPWINQSAVDQITSCETESSRIKMKNVKNVRNEADLKVCTAKNVSVLNTLSHCAILPYI